MHDDTSAIPSTGCSVLTGNNTISNYNGRTRKDFVFNGGRWYLYRTQSSAYNDYDISGYNCITVTSLNSYEIYKPFLYGVAFALFFVTIVIFFKTIKGFIHGI